MSCSRTTMQWRQWGSNPRHLGLESSTLPLSHCAHASKHLNHTKVYILSPGGATATLEFSYLRSDALQWYFSTCIINKRHYGDTWVRASLLRGTLHRHLYTCILTRRHYSGTWLHVLSFEVLHWHFSTFTIAIRVTLKTLYIHICSDIWVWYSSAS